MPQSSPPRFHTTTFHITSHPNFPHLAVRNIPHTRIPHSTPRHYSTSHMFISIHITMSDMATFHISQSHHTSHRTIIHSTTSRNTIPHHAHITPHTTHSKPHPSHTAFQPSFRTTLPCLIWRQIIPHHCIPQPHCTAHHHQYFLCTTPSFHIASPHSTSHLTFHNITFSITPYRIYSTEL